MDSPVPVLRRYAVNASAFIFFQVLGAWRCGDRPLEGSFSLQTTDQLQQQEKLFQI